MKESERELLILFKRKMRKRQKVHFCWVCKCEKSFKSVNNLFGFAVAINISPMILSVVICFFSDIFSDNPGDSLSGSFFSSSI